MNAKRKYYSYSKEPEEKVLVLIIEQYTIPQAADALGVTSNLLYTYE